MISPKLTKGRIAGYFNPLMTVEVQKAMKVDWKELRIPKTPGAEDLNSVVPLNKVSNGQILLPGLNMAKRSTG